MLGKKCRVCGVILTEENTSKSDIKYHNNYCLDCHRKLWRDKQKEYYYLDERIKNRNMKRWHKLRRKLLRLIGDKCVLCGNSNTKHLIFHEIHGIPHENNLYYVLKKKDDFITLCKFCHRSIHILVKTRKINRIYDLLKMILLGEGKTSEKTA